MLRVLKARKELSMVTPYGGKTLPAAAFLKKGGGVERGKTSKLAL